MRTILVVGAGKSSGYLIEYLLKEAETSGWQVVVADLLKEEAQKKLAGSSFGKAVALDAQDNNARASLVKEADLVISLLPPALHHLLAKDCLQYKKNLLTASYVDAAIEDLREEVKANGLLFLCEMGLDPGIDHMSAKKLVDEIQADGGTITSFVSHCGGLVAEENDDNPWHYKISWNPRNVVNAGKAGATYVQNGKTKEETYPELFAQKRYVHLADDIFCWYPNRDSLRYKSLYGLDDCETFVRTTLRHPDFMYGWNNLLELKLTDDTLFYETDGKSLKEFFKEHFEAVGFNTWLEQKLQNQLKETQNLLSNLVNLVELETKAATETKEDFMMVNENGLLEEVDLEDVKNNAAATIAFRMHESKLTLRQLFFLGMDDEETLINKGRCSAADILVFALEKKLALLPTDKDQVVMLHEIEYEKDGVRYKRESLLTIKGEENYKTAMAKTVGLPLGIAAKLILDGAISLTGIQIPTSSAIYEPVLNELEKQGIIFHNQTKTL
jgi:saccharopine dehydrogenase-like NADP-dependent oxidoreductase